jgi:integrase
MTPRREQWKGCVFRRGRTLWLKVKGPGGWKQVPTPFHVGEECKADALLSRVRDRLLAGEALDGLLGPVTVRRWSKRWLETRKELVEDARGDETALRLHVLPHIGDMEIGEVKPRHIAALVRGWMAQEYAPRTVRNVYYTMKSMFRDAAVEGLIDANPCVLGRAQLPHIVDADPEWRASAQYTRAEVVSLISDLRIPSHERLVNALLALAGLRVGEMAGLHVRNVSLDMLPLGRIVVARSYNKRGTKTKVSRWMPVHPVLGELLRDWLDRGFEATMGRPPAPDDLLVPTPPPPKGKGRHSPPWQIRDKNYTRKTFLRNLRTLAIDHRRVHDLRRTFISLARDDGADKHILRRGTHQPPQDVMELYTTVEWRKLCEEVAKLRISLPDPAETVNTRADDLGAGLGAVKQKTPRSRGVGWWRRRESNPGPKDFKRLALRAYPGEFT